MSKYKGERLYELKDAIGKTVVSVAGDAAGDCFYFIRFHDGSFIFGEPDSVYDGNQEIRYHTSIDLILQKEFGILRDDYAEIVEKYRENRKAQEKASRRRMYEELRQEFEGETS